MQVLNQTQYITSHHSLTLTGDDLIQRFWETEEAPSPEVMLTVEEKSVVEQFHANHSRLPDGRFVVPLPRKTNSPTLGESRSQAVRRFYSIESSLHAKNQFHEVKEVIDEYFQSGHAETVPAADSEKPTCEVFYLTTTKVRAVFDASAKTSTGVSLNETFLVGPTVHSTLVDVLYRAIALTDADRDLHRFVWRDSPHDSLKDFRMTRVTFGVSASSFIANMCIKQNALNHASQYPLAAKAVNEAFYVDDGVTGADSVKEAITLQHELHNLFSLAGFMLRKWNSSEPAVLERIEPELRDSQCVRQIAETETNYTKTLGIEWNASLDHFCLLITNSTSHEGLTKRQLVSDIAKTYDILGWFSPVIVTAKILLQHLWEERLQWDNPVPSSILKVWSQWRCELPILSSHHIPQYYFNKKTSVIALQLHGFSDVSRLAYAGVVYLRAVDNHGTVTTSLVMSKTKVAPLKKLTIPRLELCGALILARLLSHCRKTLKLHPDLVHAWTDSTIVLNWLSGSTRRFKTYVGNRVTHITEMVTPE